MVNIRIFVTYRQSVSDPQGETIKDAVRSLGRDEVAVVKAGRFFDVTLNTNEDEVASAVKETADQLLINFDTETYTYQVIEEV